jgi:type I restriction enzyme R subunit
VLTPEQLARQRIDELLDQAGWAVQDRKTINLGARRGVAIREFSLAAGEADYLLFVDRQAVGTVEAKKVGETLIGVEEQSAKYRVGLPQGMRAAREPLPFTYETTGVETRFTRDRRCHPMDSATARWRLSPIWSARSPTTARARSFRWQLAAARPTPL